jgi:carboxypeptidase Taq
VQRRALATARCEHAWRTQRPANDWAGFVDNFRAVLAIGREQAGCWPTRPGSRYEALMDQYEPGLTCAQVDRVFGEVRQWLPGLIQQVLEHQRTRPLIEPVGPFPVAAQRALCEQVMRPAGLRLRGRPAGRVAPTRSAAACPRTCA